jgi:hypothetical protein
LASFFEAMGNDLGMPAAPSGHWKSWPGRFSKGSGGGGTLGKCKESCEGWRKSSACTWTRRDQARKLPPTGRSTAGVSRSCPAMKPVINEFPKAVVQREEFSWS